MNTDDELNHSKEVWIGLVGIRPKQGCDILSNEAKGAYVNILAWVGNYSEYCAEIEKAVSFYSCELTEIEDPEPLTMRIKKNSVDNELVRLSEEVRTTGKVRFGTFHEFNNNEEK
jgi:hypothetical protein